MAGVSGLSEPGYNGGGWRGGVSAGGAIRDQSDKGPVPLAVVPLVVCESGNLIMLDGFGLGVLGELGARLFPGPKWVRVKDQARQGLERGHWLGAPCFP